MKVQTAAAITKLMLDVSAQLDAAVKLVMDDGDPAELVAYRNCIGNIMGQIYCDILTPIFKQYPQLAPAELRGPSAPKSEA
jgi:hypothetical protein